MSQEIKKAFQDLRNVIKANKELAKAQFTTDSTLTKRVEVVSTARNFTWYSDEPESTGGRDSAPNPLEYLIASLGACQAITYKALASTQNIQLESVEVKTKGYTDLRGFLGIDKTVRPGYLKVEFETTIVSNEPVEKVIALSQKVEQLCPVLDIFSNHLTVGGNVVIKNQSEVTV